MSPTSCPLQSYSHNLLAGTAFSRPQSSLKFFSPRIRPLVYFQLVIWHCACELSLVYMQVNGNKRLGLTRSVSKPVVVSGGLSSLIQSIRLGVFHNLIPPTWLYTHAWALQLSGLDAFSPSHPPIEKWLWKRGDCTTLSTFRIGSPKGKVLIFFIWLFGEYLLYFLHWLPNFAELELLF